jgi:hypothetical protein
VFTLRETSTGTGGALSSGYGPKVLPQAPLDLRCPLRPPGEARTVVPPPKPGGWDRKLFGSFSGRCTPSAVGCGGSREVREPGLPPTTTTRKAFSVRNLCVLVLPRAWPQCWMGFREKRNEGVGNGPEARKALLSQSGGLTYRPDYVRCATFGRSRRCSRKQGRSPPASSLLALGSWHKLFCRKRPLLVLLIFSKLS